MVNNDLLIDRYKLDRPHNGQKFGNKRYFLTHEYIGINNVEKQEIACHSGFDLLAQQYHNITFVAS